MQLTYMDKYYYKNLRGEWLCDLVVFIIGDSSGIDYEYEEQCFKKIRKLEHYKTYSNAKLINHFKLNIRTGKKTQVCFLTFGICPQMYIPSWDILIYDNRNDKANLINRVVGNISMMLKEAVVYLKNYLGMSYYINKDKEVVRKEAYPIFVLTEVIYNALVHREYSSRSYGDSIVISINDDYLEITNPGNVVYEGDQKDNYLKIPRNKYLKSLNDLIVDIPRAERGIDSIYKNMRDYGYVDPSIICEYCKYTVTLYNKSIYDFYNDKISVKAICDFCKEPKSKVEIYKHFKPNGKSTPYHFIRKYIDPLIKKELLEYTIPNIKSSKLQKIVYKK